MWLSQWHSFSCNHIVYHKTLFPNVSVVRVFDLAVRSYWENIGSVIVSQFSTVQCFRYRVLSERKLWRYWTFWYIWLTIRKFSMIRVFVLRPIVHENSDNTEHSDVSEQCGHKCQNVQCGQSFRARYAVGRKLWPYWTSWPVFRWFRSVRMFRVFVFHLWWKRKLWTHNYDRWSVSGQYGQSGQRVQSFRPGHFFVIPRVVVKRKEERKYKCCDLFRYYLLG